MLVHIRDVRRQRLSSEKKRAAFSNNIAEKDAVQANIEKAFLTASCSSLGVSNRMKVRSKRESNAVGSPDN